MEPIKNIQLSIICPENWDAMQPVNQGRHCNNCNRKVINLTNNTKAGLEKVKAENTSGFCGRFHLSQTIYSRAAVMLLTAGFTLSANVAKAQPPAIADTAKIKAVDKEPIVLGMMDPMPTYIGGEEAMLKFIANNIQYPTDDVEGTVYAQFVVDTLGNTINVVILKGLSQQANDEVIRVVKLLKWHPAIQRGKKVNTTMVIPVKFRRK